MADGTMAYSKKQSSFVTGDDAVGYAIPVKIIGRLMKLPDFRDQVHKKHARRPRREALFQVRSGKNGTSQSGKQETSLLKQTVAAAYQNSRKTGKTGFVF